MKLGDLSKYEPLLPDDRLEKLEHKLRSQFGHDRLDGATFVTFIQPAKQTTATVSGIKVPTWITEMAVFAVLSDNPREHAKKRGMRILSSGTVSLKDWRDADAEFDHYVGRPDPAHQIYRAVVADHLRKMDDLRSLLN